MITGMTSTDIARQLKIRKETVSRWKNNDLFKEELRRSRLEFMDKLLQSQLSLVKLSQQSIENALTSDTLAEYQKAMVALRFIGQFSGKLNTTRELVNRKDEIFFRLDY